MSAILQSMQKSIGAHLPSLLFAVLILIVGWIVAAFIKAVTKKGLNALRINQRVQTQTGNEIDIESGVAWTVFGVIFLFVLVAFFNALKLGAVSDPLDALLQQVMAYVPKVIGAVIIALVAWLLAKLARMAASKGFAAAGVDEKLAVEGETVPTSESIAQALYWLIILLFIPAILGALNLGGLLEPVQRMVDKILAILPNIFASVAIGVAGWFVARILRNLVVNLTTAAGLDAVGRRAGLAESVSLTKLLGTLVFIAVFVPALIAALHALKIDSISGPATNLLSVILLAIPDILAAAVILALTWYVSRFAAQLLSPLLEGVGANELPAKLGVDTVFSDGMAPAKLAGTLVVFFAMLFAVVEAANRLGFSKVSELVGIFIQLGGQILLGVVILSVGVWLANLAHSAINRTDAKNLAGLTRIAIIGLVIAMGLRAMGIADDIVNLAFGLTLGAVAVAIALSFGLGGREAAGKQMEYWLSNLRAKKSAPRTTKKT